MNARQEKIIELLRESGGWMKGKDIALVMGVSTRTIRNDVETINASLTGAAIESSFQLGYHLKTQEAPVSRAKSVIPQTPEERRSFILKQLLRHRDININDLPEKVCVSLFTIESDLRVIRQWLADSSNLRLESGRNRIRLVGQEAAKRRLYKFLLSQEVEENFLNMDTLNELYPDFDLTEIRDLLAECEKRHGIEIRETAQSMVLMHVGIALTRVLNFNPMERVEALKDLQETPQYQAAREFWDKIALRFQVTAPEPEISQLALLFMGKGSGNYYKADTIPVNGKEISLEDLTTAMLEEVRKLYGVDLTTDSKLQEGLSLHLRGLLLRLRDRTQVDNVYLEELRWRFPLIYDMGVTASRKLHEILGIQLDPNEIGFLALHLGAAYTIHRKPSKYRAVVVFPSDQALATVVIEKIRRQFQDRMDVVAVLDAYEKKRVEDLNPDLILTTLPLDHGLNVPTVQLSVFYSQENESQIFQQLNRLDKNRQKDIFQHRIRELIKPEYFLETLDASDSEDVIRKMCQPLVKAGCIPPEYADAVLEREGYASTSFAAGFALPHALNVTIRESAISVAHLDHPLQWGDHSVDFVLLLAIREEDRELLGIFFDWWIQIISDPLRFGLLKEKNGYAAFVQAILEEK
ncbi:BglG family transcription antiterminator [Faecalibaculum rodentium]|jgi:lichenan operon transcriptional antiterminator|uniref:BglG family transcription antiterminator n=1 Tax=Faecalibaculum rodentium TaxID=1702221 RepID=UPI00256F14BB|nr:PRD domain-containing protein [Faecalibaculum rodentium]